MAQEIIDTEFTPAQAAAITGVDVELQRKWRRRGFLLACGGRGSGWTRWSGQDLAYLMLLGGLAKFTGPSMAMEMLNAERADVAALYVYAHALDATGGGVAYFLNRDGRAGGDVLPRYVVSLNGAALQPFDDLSQLPPLSGAAMILDVRELGRRMAEAAPRPIASVATS